MTHGSLFTGAGGFDLGFELAGFETIGQCENDKFANKVLEYHWPDVPRHEDINDFDGREWEGVDVITGGFPCQNLSVSGRRAGLAGARSGLFFQMCRVVEEAKPRALVWENVAGLLSSNNGNDMRTVCGELASIGYFGAWRLLESAFHGVPHSRRRVFGAFVREDCGGWAGGTAILHESGSGCWNPAPFGDPQSSVERRVARCLTTREGQRKEPTCETYVVDDLGVRILTPLEMERLQGFPDEWSLVDDMSDTQRRKMMGNAVSVPVAYWVALRTKMALEAENVDG